MSANTAAASLESSHHQPYWRQSQCAFSSTAAEEESVEVDDNTFAWKRRQGMRCVAIVAHVDHGKTSLVDQLLRAAAQNNNQDTDQDRLLDSGDLEKERGITITSKVTRVQYQPKQQDDSVIINIADSM